MKTKPEYLGPEDNPEDEEQPTQEEWEEWERTQQPDHNPDAHVHAYRFAQACEISWRLWGCKP